MADDNASQEANETTDAVEEVAKETDWKAEARKWESRAKQSHASAQANEGAAKRLAELEEAQKTESQKTQERLESAERRAAELELKATRAEVAAAKGVPVDLLSGTSQAEFEAAADALIKFKADATQTGYVAPNEGRGAGANGDSTADSFARFFEKQIN